MPPPDLLVISSSSSASVCPPRGACGQHLPRAKCRWHQRHAVDGDAVRGVLQRQQLGGGGDHRAQHHRESQVQLGLADRGRGHNTSRPSRGMPCPAARDGQPQRAEQQQFGAGPPGLVGDTEDRPGGGPPRSPPVRPAARTAGHRLHRGAAVSGAAMSPTTVPTATPVRSPVTPPPSPAARAAAGDDDAVRRRTARDRGRAGAPPPISAVRAVMVASQATRARCGTGLSLTGMAARNQR